MEVLSTGGRHKIMNRKHIEAKPESKERWKPCYSAFADTSTCAGIFCPEALEAAVLSNSGMVRKSLVAGPAASISRRPRSV